MDKEYCPNCGHEIDKKNSARYCSVEKKFVCQSCEARCTNYSSKLLPNGTNCFKLYRNEEYQYRLLTSQILAPEYEVTAAMAKYEAEKRTGILAQRFQIAMAQYPNINPSDIELKAKVRTELAAMQQVIIKRELANPMLSRWAKEILTNGICR